VVGGGTALLSHLVKAGSRLAINSSPEPVTNVTASVVEDFAVLGVVWFAIENPGPPPRSPRSCWRRARPAVPAGPPGPSRLAALEETRALPRETTRDHTYD
jgi:hypothetical protein